MKTLERRFRLVALIIIQDERFLHLYDKIDLVADAIDSNFPGAIKMVKLLEDEVLLMTA